MVCPTSASEQMPLQPSDPGTVSASQSSQSECRCSGPRLVAFDPRAWGWRFVCTPLVIAVPWSSLRTALQVSSSCVLPQPTPKHPPLCRLKNATAAQTYWPFTVQFQLWYQTSVKGMNKTNLFFYQTLHTRIVPAMSVSRGLAANRSIHTLQETSLPPNIIEQGR